MGQHNQHLSGRWQLGFALAAAAMLFWATLPVALKVGLEALDAWTLTWFRFAFAAALTWLYLLARGSHRELAGLSRSGWLLLLVAGVMLVANYVGYLISLDMTTPGNAQVLIQMAPLLMVIGGVLIYKERMSWLQKIGFAAIVLGLAVFYHDQWQALASERYRTGVLIMVAAAAAWAVYALIQKKLLGQLSPQTMLGFIYLLATVVLWPFAHPSALLQLSTGQWLAVLYAGLNTVGAYGAFSESLQHWEASRTGMVIALSPVVALFFINLLAQFVPGLVAPEHLQWLGWLGVVLIVFGSMAASLAQSSAKRQAALLKPGTE